MIKKGMSRNYTLIHFLSYLLCPYDLLWDTQKNKNIHKSFFHSSWATWLIPAIAATVVGIVCRYYMFDHKSSWVWRPVSIPFCSSGGLQMFNQNLLTLNTHCQQRVRLWQQEKEGKQLDRCSWDEAWNFIKLSAFIFIVFHHHYGCFPSCWIAGSQLKPLPDVHIHHPSQTYRKCRRAKLWNTARISSYCSVSCLLNYILLWCFYWVLMT